MSVRRFAAALLVTILVSGLAACTAESADPIASAPASRAPSVEASPTPDVLVVGSAERPPALLGGDCARLLSSEDAASVVGGAAELRERQEEGFSSVANAGGLSCTWYTADGTDSLWVGVLPASSLVGVDIAGIDQHRTGDECSWYCTVVSEQAGFVVVTSLNTVGASLEDVRAASQAATPIAAGNARAGAVDWARDRGSWLAVDCAQLGADLGSRLGIPLSGQPWDRYIDPPLTIGLLADAASWFGDCKFVDPDGRFMEFASTAGSAWGVETVGESNGLPAPWHGSATESWSFDTNTAGTGWHMSDGVNDVVLGPVPTSWSLSIDAVAAEVAASLTP